MKLFGYLIYFNRDALATRLYSVRMMEQFISNRKIAYELTEFDEKTVNLYMVCIYLVFF